MSILRLLACIVGYFFLAICLLALLYRGINPVSTLMVKRWALLQEVRHHYVPMRRMPPHLVKAVIVAEDARFCEHRGVDWSALKGAVVEAAEEFESPRGASTITMQVARNLFLWQGRSYVRKVMEIPLALMMDLFTGKRRTMEIYLNIAEWGKGIFGAEAASQYYFKKSVRNLNEREAALLVATLPSPIRRNPENPGAYTKLYANKIARRLQADTALMACVR